MMVRKSLIGLTFGVLISLLIQNSCATNLPVLHFETTKAADLDRLFFVADSSSNTAYLNELRLKFNLDRLVATCTTELEKVLVVTNWVHGLWEHNGWNRPVQNDPISILTEVLENGQQFRCVEYSRVVSGCLNALGITSRLLRLRTADVQTREYGAGHVVVEAYLVSLDKWIMIDGQANCVPALNGVPLNAVELQNALVSQQAGLQMLSLASDLDFTILKYIDFIGQYLYYFQTDLALDVLCEDDAPSLMLVPIGATNPVVFQIKYPLVNVTYTHSVASFYQKPV